MYWNNLLKKLENLLIYLFKFFTGHWQKPLCGRISDGWRKRRKWKLKNCFHFLPLFFLFSSLFWPRARMTAVFNFDNVEDNTTYYTHYIRWIIEPKSKQKKLLATTTTYNKNWKTKWKNLMSALKKKQRKELPRYTKN